MNRTSFSFLISATIHIALLILVLWGFTTQPKVVKTINTKVISLSHIVIKKPKPIPEVKVIQEKKYEPKTIKKKRKTKKKSVKKRQKKYTKKPVVKKIEKSHTFTDISTRYILINKSKIYQAIQRAKRYPRMAKKLGIQGIALVTFTLTTSGKVINIQTSGAKSILLKSAKKTIIEASSSFPRPSQNITISVPISYKLR
ncbi:MAG TPA: TonB family protein [Campylobacterales bacterium]|nr:TonB family protein [Campylobacterales bacterium]